MQDIGHPSKGAATGVLLSAVGAACALVPSLWMWGFTVDDALIALRYAQHVAAGTGYRFDAAGPSTDGVTPLPWAFLLVPLAASDALVMLTRVKVLGVVCWTLAGALLGRRIAATRAPLAVSTSSLLVMGLSFPIGAWAASGMETGVATALATIAVTRLGRSWMTPLLAGLVAALRPEMVVWALAIAVGDAWLRKSRAAAALALVPFVLCAIIRLAVFGRPAPLAVLAKPSDLSHGALYVGAGLVVVLLPVLVLAPFALWRRRGEALVIVAAFVAHACAVLAAGGDWMPYARLLVPAAPSLVLAAALLAENAVWPLVRSALAAALGVLLLVKAAPAGRHVDPDRRALVARARPVLGNAHAVAALDVGWASCAAPDTARIVDLAGLTDPQIALLPGGHTSKHVDVAMLLDRNVDTILIYSSVRAVEVRLLQNPLFAERFVAAEELPLGDMGASYTVYRRR